MAFGALKGSFSANVNSITNPLPTGAVVSGSGAVNVGDLVYCVVGEQLTGTTATFGTCTDNLNNTYTPANAESVGGSGTVGGRAYYSIVTVAGTITAVSVAATASSNNAVIAAVIIEGPFAGVDANPANASDLTSPFTCPATGALARAIEVVMAWSVCNGANTFAATSPNTLGPQPASQTILSARIGYQTVSSTSTVSPAFTSGTAPTTNHLGPTSFNT